MFGHTIQRRTAGPEDPGLASSLYKVDLQLLRTRTTNSAWLPLAHEGVSLLALAGGAFCCGQGGTDMLCCPSLGQGVRLSPQPASLLVAWQSEPV